MFVCLKEVIALVDEYMITLFNECPVFQSVSSFANDIKTESTRKLSICNFQWTKTLYQNNLKNIAFFFYSFQGLKMSLVICNNTKENFSWESEQTNVKFHKNCENTGKILKI